MSRRFSSNEEFYVFVDNVTDRLRSAGFVAEASTLHEILHEIAWTTSSELLGELGLAIRDIQAKAGSSLPCDLA